MKWPGNYFYNISLSVIKSEYLRYTVQFNGFTEILYRTYDLEKKPCDFTS